MGLSGFSRGMEGLVGTDSFDLNFRHLSIIRAAEAARRKGVCRSTRFWFQRGNQSMPCNQSSSALISVKSGEEHIILHCLAPSKGPLDDSFHGRCSRVGLQDMRDGASDSGFRRFSVTSPVCLLLLINDEIHWRFATIDLIAPYVWRLLSMAVGFQSDDDKREWLPLGSAGVLFRMS
jgi:hypothetical protein